MKTKKKQYLWIILGSCLGICALVTGSIVRADQTPSQNSPQPGSNAPPIYYVIFHSPGPKWIKGKSFREQPDVMKHVEYMSQFADSKKLLMGGPFLDNSGGMVIFVAKDIGEVEKISQNDPTVKSGLLLAKVRPWMVAITP